MDYKSLKSPLLGITFLSFLLVFNACGSSDNSSGNSSIAGASAQGSVALCGNGVIENGEACDGTEFGGATCGDFGNNFVGSLACNTECQIDSSDCVQAGYAGCNQGIDESNCRSDEECLGIPDNLGSCVVTGCGSTADCPPKPEGVNAEIACEDGAGSTFCHLACNASEDCPEGQTCQGNICTQFF